MTLLNRASNLDTAAVNELITQELDWSYICKTSSLLGVSPLHYYHLKDVEKQGLEDVISIFRNHFHMSLANYLQLRHEFDCIAEQLSDRGIPCMGLKGIVLANEIYPTPALRPMFDIDILVKEEDLPGVEEVIRKSGYAPHRNESIRELPTYQYHLHYTKNSVKPVILEVHWALGEKNRYHLDERGIWNRARKSPSGTHFEMSDDDTLLYLSLHFFKHFLFKRLSWLCDIHEWIGQKEIRWDQVIERARAQSITTFLAYTLAIYEAFYGVTLPISMRDILDIGPIRKSVLDRYVKAYDMFHPMDDNNWFIKRLFAFTSIDRAEDRFKFTLDAFKRDVG